MKNLLQNVCRRATDEDYENGEILFTLEEIKIEIYCFYIFWFSGHQLLLMSQIQDAKRKLLLNLVSKQ